MGNNNKYTQLQRQYVCVPKFDSNKQQQQKKALSIKLNDDFKAYRVPNTIIHGINRSYVIVMCIRSNRKMNIEKAKANNAE